MRAVLTVLILVIFIGGCRTTPWVRGDFTEGIPRHSEKFPREMSFFVVPTEPRVQLAFERALVARGFRVESSEEVADTIIRIDVKSWEYNDAGFGGFFEHDDMTLSVKCIDRSRRRTLCLATLNVRSDFRLIAKYVETL